MWQTFLTNLSRQQHLLAQQTSLHELLTAPQTLSMEQLLDDQQFAEDYPDLTPVGLIGYDRRKQKFVLLKVDPHLKPIDSGENLSGREQEVLQLVIAGYSNAQIARQLVISESTVKVHVHKILQKLGVQSRTEAAMYAVKRGWVSVSAAAAA